MQDFGNLDLTVPMQEVMQLQEKERDRYWNPSTADDALGLNIVERRRRDVLVAQVIAALMDVSKNKNESFRQQIISLLAKGGYFQSNVFVPEAIAIAALQKEQPTLTSDAKVANYITNKLKGQALVWNDQVKSNRSLGYDSNDSEGIQSSLFWNHALGSRYPSVSSAYKEAANAFKSKLKKVFQINEAQSWDDVLVGYAKIRNGESKLRADERYSTIPVSFVGNFFNELWEKWLDSASKLVNKENNLALLQRFESFFTTDRQLGDPNINALQQVVDARIASLGGQGSQGNDEEQESGGGWPSWATWLLVGIGILLIALLLIFIFVRKARAPKRSVEIKTSLAEARSASSLSPSIFP